MPPWRSKRAHLGRSRGREWRLVEAMQAWIAETKEKEAGGTVQVPQYVGMRDNVSSSVFFFHISHMNKNGGSQVSRACSALTLLHRAGF